MVKQHKDGFPYRFGLINGKYFYLTIKQLSDDRIRLSISYTRTIKESELLCLFDRLDFLCILNSSYLKIKCLKFKFQSYYFI